MKTNTKRIPKRFYQVIKTTRGRRKVVYLCNDRKQAEIYVGCVDDVADLLGWNFKIEPLSQRKLLGKAVVQ